MAEEMRLKTKKPAERERERVKKRSAERIFESYYFSKRRILKDLKLYVEWYYLAKSGGWIA